MPWCYCALPLCYRCDCVMDAVVMLVGSCSDAVRCGSDTFGCRCFAAVTCAMLSDVPVVPGDFRAHAHGQLRTLPRHGAVHTVQRLPGPHSASLGRADSGGRKQCGAGVHDTRQRAAGEMCRTAAGRPACMRAHMRIHTHTKHTHTKHTRTYTEHT